MSCRLTPGPMTVDELHCRTNTGINAADERESAGAVLRAGLNDTIRYDTIRYWSLTWTRKMGIQLNLAQSYQPESNLI